MASGNSRFRGCVMSSLLAGVIASASAMAQDDVRALRSEVDALKKEVQDLKAGQAARPAAQPPAGDKSATFLGATVTLYGTLNADVGNVERTGATASGAPLNSLVGAPGTAPTSVPDRQVLRSNSSNFGIRGKRDLFAGLSAVFQLESAIGVDGGASTLAGRDTFLGIAGPFGSVLFGGNIDSPYKRGVQGKDPFFATGIATQKGILGSPGFNVTSVNAVAGTTVGGNAAGAQQQNAGFDARLNNLLMYRSPVFAGFSAEIGYGLNEQKSTSTGAQIDPRVISLLGRYELGRMFASYAYERRDDVFGLNSLLTFVPGTGATGALFTPPDGASSRDSGNKLGLGYALPNTDLLFVWERLKYETNVGTVSEYDRNAWVVSVSHRIARHRGIASFGKAGAGSCALAAGAACSTAGLGGKQLALGYVYSLDTATALYAFWSRIENEEAAAYNFGVSGAPAAGVGADPQALALGIRYQF